MLVITFLLVLYFLHMLDYSMLRERKSNKISYQRRCKLVIFLSITQWSPSPSIKHESTINNQNFFPFFFFSKNQIPKTLKLWYHKSISWNQPLPFIIIFDSSAALKLGYILAMLFMSLFVFLFIQHFGNFRNFFPLQQFTRLLIQTNDLVIVKIIFLNFLFSKIFSSNVFFLIKNYRLALNIPCYF